MDYSRSSSKKKLDEPLGVWVRGPGRWRRLRKKAWGDPHQGPSRVQRQSMLILATSRIRRCSLIKWARQVAGYHRTGIWLDTWPLQGGKWKVFCMIWTSHLSIPDHSCQVKNWGIPSSNVWQALPKVIVNFRICKLFQHVHFEQCLKISGFGSIIVSSEKLFNWRLIRFGRFGEIQSEE